nr:hypothetical protein [Tanacetum cinerariifolium]
GPDGGDVDVHICRLMIGSLMYLTSSRPDIMFSVCACARFQVTPKVSHLHAVKRMYSDYVGASLDQKSTTRGCQFIGCILISWQYKKQTVVATSSTEAEYVAAASCYAQVLWIQNQLRTMAQAKDHKVGKEEEIQAFWFKEVKEDTAVEMDADTLGRMEKDVTAVKEINAAESEPTVFDDKEMQEKHLDNIKKYQSLKRKPISIAQARKNMIVYLKNMVGYKIQHFKGMTYDQVRPIFEREYNDVQTFLKSDKDKEPSKKRVAKETLLQESFKKLRAKVEVLGSFSTQQDTPTVDPQEISEEDVQNMMQIIPMAEFKVEALQIKVGGITEAYQRFEDMLKSFDREYMDALWRLVKEKFSTTMPTVDREKALWDVVLPLMLSAKLQVDEDCEMARDLAMKIFMEANKPKSTRSLDTSSN